jgi:hypothetical protein
MRVATCTEAQALEIENYLNDNWLVSWFEDRQNKINREIRIAYDELNFK